jgi:hypothetical protein
MGFLKLILSLIKLNDWLILSWQFFSL